MAPPAGAPDTRRRRWASAFWCWPWPVLPCSTPVSSTWGPGCPSWSPSGFVTCSRRWRSRFCAAQARGKSLLATQHPRFQLLRGCLLLTVSALSFRECAVHAGGRVHRLRHDHAPGRHAAGRRVPQGKDLDLALDAGGGRVSGRVAGRATRADIVGWASLLPMAMVFIYAWFQILTSKMAQTEDPLTMHFYTGWVGALVTSAIVPWPGRHCPSQAHPGRAVPDRPHGHGRPLSADPGVRQSTSLHAHALPLRPDRLRHVVRLAGVRPRAQQPWSSAASP